MPTVLQKFADTRKEKIERKLNLLRERFHKAIYRYIDRMNKNGVGLQMHVDPPSSGTSRIQNVHFYLERSPDIRLTATLDVDILKINGFHWAGYADFQRLVPRIVYNLVTLEEIQLVEEAMRAESEPNAGP